MGKAIDYGWPWDPDVKAPPRGLPPEGHIRRCQGAIRRSNPKRQCTQWALKGRNYCRVHGGRQPLYEKMGHYSRNAGKTLKSKLEKLAAMDPDERNSLAEEIDLSRLLCERNLKLFDATHYPPEGTVIPEKLKVMAAEGLRSALADVTEIVAKSAIVRSRSEGVVGIEDLGYIIHQIKKILEDEDVDPRVSERLSEIRLPKRGSEMSEDQVIDMLGQLSNSVPSVEPS